MDNPIIEFHTKTSEGEWGEWNEMEPNALGIYRRNTGLPMRQYEFRIKDKRFPLYKVGQRFVWEGQGYGHGRTYTILSVHTATQEGQESFVYFTKVDVGRGHVSYAVHSERFISESLVLSN